MRMLTIIDTLSQYTKLANQNITTSFSQPCQLQNILCSVYLTTRPSSRGHHWPCFHPFHHGRKFLVYLCQHLPEFEPRGQWVRYTNKWLIISERYVDSHDVPLLWSLSSSVHTSSAVGAKVMRKFLRCKAILLPHIISPKHGFVHGL